MLEKMDAFCRHHLGEGGVGRSERVSIFPLTFLNTKFCNLRPSFTDHEGVERKMK